VQQAAAHHSRHQRLQRWLCETSSNTSGRKDVVNEILVHMTPQDERFADVRLMMVNVLDTSRPTETVSAHRRRHESESGGSESAAEEFEEEDQEEEDETTYYNGHCSNTNTTCFGQNVCYKMVTQACPENRTAVLETGFLNHAHYQRFTIPHKLTPDSAKASDYLKDKNEGFQLVQSRAGDLLREYNKTLQIHNALGTSINHSGNLTNAAAVKLTYLQATELKLNKLTRNVLFYGSKHTERMAVLSPQQALRVHGLEAQDAVSLLRHAGLRRAADCILVDHSSLKDVAGKVAVHDLIVQLRVRGY
jgi:hypothetical protein